MLYEIDAARVFTRDLARARTFYETALGLASQQASNEVALFATGGATLILEATGPDDQELVGRFTGIFFRVADMTAAVAALAARGVLFDGPPEVQPWGGTLARLRDPGGNVVTLVEYPGG